MAEALNVEIRQVKETIAQALKELKDAEQKHSVQDSEDTRADLQFKRNVVTHLHKEQEHLHKQQEHLRELELETARQAGRQDYGKAIENRIPALR